MVKAQCSCGAEKDVEVYAVKSGRSKSCGCLHKDILRERATKTAASNKVFGHYRRGALSRGYSFELSLPEFLEVTQQPCYYCGAPPSNIQKGVVPFIYSGVDRVDNNLGYTKDNIVPSCFHCNKMKGTHSQEDFLKQIAAISSNLILNKGNTNGS